MFKRRGVNAEVIAGGRLFHALAVAIGNTRSLIVLGKVRGTKRVEVDAGRRRRRDSLSAAGYSSRAY
jgi:hypothetical protein